ncbi:hypothetical protein, partial [Meridianimarinicoccus zhengii]|uniref:hypothetical protein n=1 Tax=Meridianimarinicoccus zhengii TaxID=2056810 RepID=UPI001C9B22DB
KPPDHALRPSGKLHQLDGRYPAKIDKYRSGHIAELSRESIVQSDAEHLGFEGYFLFETNEASGLRGIRVLAKVASLDAAFSMLDFWAQQTA